LSLYELAILGRDDPNVCARLTQTIRSMVADFDLAVTPARNLKNAARKCRFIRRPRRSKPAANLGFVAAGVPQLRFVPAWCSRFQWKKGLNYLKYCPAAPLRSG